MSEANESQGWPPKKSSIGKYALSTIQRDNGHDVTIVVLDTEDGKVWVSNPQNPKSLIPVVYPGNQATP